MDAERYHLALAFWTSALQYLQLVENVARETIAQRNTTVLIRDYDGRDISEDELLEHTRWSDRAIIIPLLFNLLHGMELLTKGFLLTDPAESVKKSHAMSSLAARFEASFPDELVIIEFLRRYTQKRCMPRVLARFLSDNSLSVDGLYQALRYPSPDFVAIHDYVSLKYQGEAGVSFFARLVKDIRRVRIASVALGRRLGPG